MWTSDWSNVTEFIFSFFFFKFNNQGWKMPKSALGWGRLVHHTSSSSSSLPSEVKQWHGGLPQLFWSFPLLVGVWRSTSILVQNPKQSQSKNWLQRKNCHGNRKTDPETASEPVRNHVLKQVSNCVEAADSQFIPLDVVEKVLVGSDSLGLDGFKEVLSIVGEGAHQVVLLITVKEQPEPE